MKKKTKQVITQESIDYWRYNIRLATSKLCDAMIDSINLVSVEITTLRRHNKALRRQVAQLKKEVAGG